MDANDVLMAIGEPDRFDELGAWVIETYRGMRNAILAENEQRQRQGENAKSSPDRCRSVGIDDTNEEYVSKNDIADVFRVSVFVREEMLKVPPEDPTVDEAVFWLARKELLQLLSRYSQALIFFVGAQRNLHVPGKGLCNAEVKNLFCEPGDDNGGLFIWVGILVALHRWLPRSEVDEDTLNQLAHLFGQLTEIYYNLTELVYSTKLAVKCRCAFSAFWRHLGAVDFAPLYEEYAKCRTALDTAILNGNAGKFVNPDLSMASMAQSLLGINKSLAELRNTNVAPVADEPKPTNRRGPKGQHKMIPVKYAAMVYKVSNSTICSWDKGKGKIPINYPGRNVSIDEFNSAATRDMEIIGHQEGVAKRVANGIEKRKMQ